MTKIYTRITSIELADDHNVYAIGQEHLPPSFHADLKGFYKNNLKQACEDYKIATTKQECLNLLVDTVITTGYGRHSNRKLWQLPARIKTQISKMLIGIEIE